MIEKCTYYYRLIVYACSYFSLWIYVSVDRTYRNREALRRLSTLDNSGELYTEQYQKYAT